MSKPLARLRGVSKRGEVKNLNRVRPNPKPAPSVKKRVREGLPPKPSKSVSSIRVGVVGKARKTGEALSAAKLDRIEKANRKWEIENVDRNYALCLLTNNDNIEAKKELLAKGGFSFFTVGLSRKAIEAKDLGLDLVIVDSRGLGADSSVIASELAALSSENHGVVLVLREVFNAEAGWLKNAVARAAIKGDIDTPEYRCFVPERYK